MEPFVHLRVQSCHSHGRGGSSVAALVQRAAASGYRRLALADRNGLYGAVDFYRLARERGIVPILGAEVDDPADPARAVTVLAADRDGFTSLCRLVTRRHLEPGFDLAAEVGSAWGRDAACWPTARTCWPGWPPPRRGQSCTPPSARATWPGTAASPACWPPGRAPSGSPLVAAGDVLFASPDDLPVQRLVRAIGLLTTVAAIPPEEAALPAQHLAPPAEMAGRFRDFPGALEAAARLADECAVELDVGIWKYPG